MKKQIKKVDKSTGVMQVTTTDERWYTKEVINQDSGLPDILFVPSVTWICNSYPKGVEFYKWLASKGWDESQAIKNEAGEKGSCVHSLIEKLLKGGTVECDELYNGREITVDEYEAVISFKDWYEETQPEVVSVEKSFFNEEDGYAGTVDLVCKIDGENWIVDFKTSSYIWMSHKLQLSSYRRGLKIANCKLAILQVGYSRNRKGFKFTEVEDCYELFEAAKLIWAKENAGVRPKQRDLPIKIKLNIK